MKLAIPQFEKLEFVRDKNTGHPHLQARYEYWHSSETTHQEDQFSDGTLRLIGLMWSLLVNDSIILLEEPELSLNLEIVAQLAPLISNMQKDRRCQVLTSTQSDTLLIEPGIDGSEVILLMPTKNGTEVKPSSDSDTVCTLLKNGITVGEIVMTRCPKESSLLEWH